jgi:hypothetical protein
MQALPLHISGQLSNEQITSRTEDNPVEKSKNPKKAGNIILIIIMKNFIELNDINKIFKTVFFFKKNI